MTEIEFKQLAQEGYNRIPLVAEAFADLETPLSLYLKLAHVQNKGERSFLLESVVGASALGATASLACPPAHCCVPVVLAMIPKLVQRPRW
jgi:anthranilate synthase component 1